MAGFSDQSDIIKQSLSELFDRVCDLYERVNPAEHRNETICFVGVDSATVGEAVSNGDGGSTRTAEVRYLVRALSKRDMSADDLCELFDGGAIPAVEGCGLGIEKIEREPCLFSKEHGAYTVSAKVTVRSEEADTAAAEGIGFSIDGAEFACMRSYEVSRAVKTAETPTIGMGIITRSVGARALKIKLSGVLSAESAGTVYSSLAAHLGGRPVSLTVAGLIFPNMTMTELTLGGSLKKGSEIAVGFTEVNEV